MTLPTFNDNNAISSDYRAAARDCEKRAAVAASSGDSHLARELYRSADTYKSLATAAAIVADAYLSYENEIEVDVA